MQAAGLMPAPPPALNPHSEQAQALAAEFEGTTQLTTVSDALTTADVEAAAPNASVFRAFNTYGWENFADPLYEGVPGDLFYAGPDGEARAVVEQPIEDVGLRPVRVGGRDQVGPVDEALRLWFTLASGGRGRNLAFKVLSR